MTAIANRASERDYSAYITLCAVLTSFAIIAVQATTWLYDIGTMTREVRLPILAIYYALLLLPLSLLAISYGLRHLLTDRYAIALLVSLASIVASVAANAVVPQPLLLFAPLLMLVLFHILLRIDDRADLSFCAVLLALWSAAPVLIVLIFRQTRDLFYVFDTFRGFSPARTDYGYVAGLAILLLIAGKVSFARAGLLVLMMAGIFLAQNRAMQLALLMVGGYFALSRVKSWRNRAGIVVVLLILVLILQLAAYAVRGVGLLQLTGGRDEILLAGVGRIPESGLFGAGAFYQQIENVVGYGIEPHNSILQSIMNFGLLGTLAWIWLLLTVYLRVTIYGRAVLLYWIVVGLFHPGFDAFLFLPENILALLAATQAPVESPWFVVGRDWVRSLAGLLAPHMKWMPAQLGDDLASNRPKSSG